MVLWQIFIFTVFYWTNKGFFSIFEGKKYWGHSLGRQSCGKYFFGGLAPFRRSTREALWASSSWQLQLRWSLLMSEISRWHSFTYPVATESRTPFPQKHRKWLLTIAHLFIEALLEAAKVTANGDIRIYESAITVYRFYTIGCVIRGQFKRKIGQAYGADSTAICRFSSPDNWPGKYYFITA